MKRKTNFKVISAFIIFLSFKISVVYVSGCTVKKEDLQIIDNFGDSDQELLRIINAKRYEQKIIFTTTTKDLQISIPSLVKANLNENEQKKFKQELFFVNKIIIKENQQELKNQDFQKFDVLNLIVNYDYQLFKHQILELKILIENDNKFNISLNSIFNDRILTLQKRLNYLLSKKAKLESDLSYYKTIKKEKRTKILDLLVNFDERTKKWKKALLFIEDQQQVLKDFKNLAWNFDCLPEFNNETVIAQLVDDFSEETPELRNIWKQVLASKNNNRAEFEKSVEILLIKLNDHLLTIHYYLSNKRIEEQANFTNQSNQLRTELSNFISKVNFIWEDLWKIQAFDLVDIDTQTSEINTEVMMKKEYLNDELIVKLKKLQNSISDFRNSFFK